MSESGDDDAVWVGNSTVDCTKSGSSCSAYFLRIGL